MNKLVIIVIAALILGGGGYYEFFYLPPVYGNAVLNVVKEFETASQDAPRPENVSNQAEKIVAAKRQIDLLKTVEMELSRLQPPLFGELRQFHNDLLAVIDTERKVYSPFEEQIMFFGGILETRDLFKPKNFDEKTTRAKDIQRYFEEMLPKMQSRIDKIFGKEPSFAFKEVTFTELTSAWEEAKPGFTVWLGFIKRIDPEQRLGTSAAISPTQDEEVALAKINRFSELVEKASARNVTLSQSSSPSDTENREREQRFNKVLEELKEKYGK